MIKRSLLTIIIALSFLLLPQRIFAQTSYIVDPGEITVIKNPQQSQAYYSQLQNDPGIYYINSDREFELFISILVPDTKDTQKNFRVRVGYLPHDHDVGQNIVKLDPYSHDWTKKFNEITGDWFWQGPQFSHLASPGEYTIEVSNYTNSGKYVLVVGEDPPALSDDIKQSFMVLPQLKTWFFEKPIYQVIFSSLGLILLFPLLVIIAVTIIVVKSIKISSSQKTSKRTSRKRKSS